MTRKKILLLVLALVVVAIVGGLWYLNSGSFNERVRERVVAELEKATGGQVELKGFRWKLSSLEFEFDEVTVRGLERPTEQPFVHLDKLYVQAKIISLFDRQIGLRRVVAERPAIHVVVYPDGTTNQPAPATPRQSKELPVRQLFDLAIDRLELRNGELLWNDERLPLDLAANDVSLGVTYASAARRYDGQLNIGKLNGKFRNYRPVSSTAEVHFSLAPTEAEVKSLRWSAQQTRLEASGKLVDFKSPKLQAAYKLSVDLQQVASIARLRELRGGVMEIHGQGTYSLRDFSSAGKIFLRDVAWQQAGVKLSDANLGADFSVTPEQLALSQLKGSIFEGAVSGDVQVRHWLARPAASGQVARGEQQTGTANLRLEAVDIAAVAQALSTPSLPLTYVNPAGKANGMVAATWKGAPRRAQAKINLAIAPPAQVAPDQLPISAQLDAAYNAPQEALNVAKFHLATRGTQVSATGILAPNSRLRVELATTDLSEFKPAFRAFNVTQLPVELRGRASFKGNVSGKLASPSLAGHLEIRDFAVLLPSRSGVQPGLQNASAANSATSLQRVHWDLLIADIELAPTSATVRNGRLGRGSTQVAFDLSGTLRNYKFTDRSPFKAAVNVRDASVAELQQIAGFNYSLEGKLNLSLNLSGTRLDPRGNGRLQITDGTAYQQAIRSLTTDLELAAQEVRLKNINLATNGSRLTGAAAYQIKQQTYRFDLQGTGWDLVSLRPLQTAKVSVKGIANFRAQGSGTARAPVVNGELHVRQLVINEEAVGDLDVQATTRGTQMLVNARSNFQDSDLSADGAVQLREDLPGEFEIKFSRLDFDPLLRTFLKGRITEHSTSEGTVRIRGPLRRPKELEAIADIRQLRLTVEGITLENRGPLLFTVKDQRLKVERMQIVGEGTDLNAAGSLPFRRGENADLRANGRINLKLLQSFNPDVLAYGVTTLSVNVGGDIMQPALTGDVQIANAGISFIDLPNGLSDINGTLTFNQDRLQVQTLTARTGGGMLNIGGFISYSDGLFANLMAQGKDIRVRYPPGVSAVADADLRFVGNTRRSTLTGDVTVTKFGLNPRFDFALYLARSAQPPPVPDTDSPLNNMQLDLHIVSTPDLQVQTSLAKVSGDADLRVRGTAARPIVLGRINIVEGDIFFNGTRYHLERGDILFTNPVRTEPVLNLEASARVRDVDITLAFHGPVDKLQTTYRSDPPLPTADIIALLAMGRTREETALSQQPTPNLTETASNAILSQALNATISSRVQRLFGVSRIKIDPQVGGPESNPNARLTVEQQVSDKVTLTYITDLARSAQQIIQMEVHVNKHVSILAVRDEYGVVGFDLKIRQRKW